MTEATIPRRTENSLATRRALLEAAEAQFTSAGYGAASIDQIVSAARVTKGALYHHFRDKRELFAAVCVEVERRWVEEMVAAVGPEADARKRLEMGCEAFLDACTDPALRRILLIEAPAVLSLEQRRDLDIRFGLGLLITALSDGIAAGAVDRQPVEPLAHLLLGALNEAALTIATAADPAAERARMGDALGRLIAGLERPERS